MAVHGTGMGGAKGRSRGSFYLSTAALLRIDVSAMRVTVFIALCTLGTLPVAVEAEVVAAPSRKFSEKSKMNARSNNELVEANLNLVLYEMEAQPDVASSYPQEGLRYADHLAEIREFIDIAGEYGLAYDYIVAALEVIPYKISGKAAVGLLEVGLLMGFKSKLEQDKRFDKHRNDAR